MQELLFARGIFLLSCWLALAASCSNCTGAVKINAEKRIFYLLTLVPYSNPEPSLNPSWNGGDDIQPVLDLAVDQINRRDDILGNISLQLIHQSDGCDEVLTPLTLANFLFEAYSRRRKLVGVIGPSCSSSTAGLAPVTERSETDVVSVHFAGSPRFEDRLRYPHHLGLLGSTESFVQGFLHLIRKGNWTRIAVLYDESRQYYTSTTELLMKMSKEFSGINVEYVSSVSRTKIPLEEVQSHMLRVIFVLTPISLAQMILCRAQYLEMSFSRYQYVIMSATLSNLNQSVSFHYKDKPYKCSSEDLMRTVLNRSFLLHYNILPNDGRALLANITYSEFINAYARYRENYTLSTGKKSTESYFATIAYDAVWSWALVLDRLTKSLEEDFKVQYGDRNTSNHIVQEFYHLNFEGMSGTVSFDNQSGFVRRAVIIIQVQPDGEVKCNQAVACGTQTMFIKDSFENKVDRESSELATFFLLVTVIEFFIVVALHVVMLKNLGTSSVKASSPRLLNISYMGIYILILGAFLWTLFSAASVNIQFRHHFCQLLWAWTIPIGFSLSFSPVLMKTWRLYRIFEHYLDPGPLLSTTYLVTGTLLITLLYLAVSIIWTASDRFMLESRDHFDGKSPDRVVLAIEFHCTCHFQFLWLLLLGLLSFLLLSFGTILAIMTRNIPNTSFATSSLRMLVFLMSIVIVLGGSLYAISELVENQNDRKSYFNFSSLCIVLNTVVGLFITFVFLPPLLPLINRTKVVIYKLRSSSPLVI